MVKVLQVGDVDAISEKNKLSIANKLALASLALLSSTTSAEAIENDWDFSASLLTYSEPSRVSALELIFSANKVFDDDASLSYNLVLDSLTGASANGAIEQESIQTFTRPSGRGQYSVEALETPLDDTFKDTRLQGNISWSDSFATAYRYLAGGNLSKEYDYQSMSINGEISRELNKKNTVISIGVSFAIDSVSPEGGRPVAKSSMVVDRGQYPTVDDYWAAFDATRLEGDENIDTSEILLGWTQVFSRRMIMQFNYSFADMSGYLTDPFKIISVIDNNALAKDYIYESRPDSRAQQSFFSLLKYHLDDSVLNFSYRYFTDDWDIVSNTIDFKWHLYGADNTFWQPHIRLYQQSAADFYRAYLSDGEVLPIFASADYRVGEMTTFTLGLKYGFLFNKHDRAEIRIEYYKQLPESNGAEKINAVEKLELYPEVDAFTLQFSYHF